jgi:serine/threonine protein kinase
MAAGLEAERESRQRFEREARIAGQLVHRNIVTVFDLGEDQGRPYVVMELLNGRPFREHLQRAEARSLDAKLDLMLQICDGLHAAHERSVVHGDVKPRNLFVQHDGTVKILDFAVARLAAGWSAATRSLSGAPEFMSPEQAMGRPVDKRSDIFSAAGVFQYMVTRRAPFGESDLTGVLDAVLHRPPAAITEREAPEALGRVLLKALSKNPDDRYQSCSHLRAELEQLRRTIADDRHRLTRAALERYRQTEALIEERRMLGRRLLVEDIDHLCGQSALRLARRFPEIARAVAEDALLAPLERHVAAAALARLQSRYNAELAAVDVLRAAAGSTQGGGSLRDRASAALNRFRGDREGSKGSS